MVNIPEVQTHTNTLRISPNPAQCRCFLPVPKHCKNGTIHVFIYAPTAQLLSRKAFQNTNSPGLELVRIRPGIYFIRSTFNNESATEQLIIY